MPALALLAASVLAAGLPIPPEAWTPPERSFGALMGFRVRVDVHAPGRFAARLGERVQQQIERSLRHEGIQVVSAPTGPTPTIDRTGVLILDLHVVDVVDVADGVALAWALHASQFVHLPTGTWAFASTWEVGDLVRAPRESATARLRDGIQAALDDFCRAYLTARPHDAPEPEPRQDSAEPTEPSPDGAAL
jgi:hypothetical protein